MIAVSADDWQVMNQRYLMTALSRIREALEHHATHDRADSIGNVPAESPYEGPDNVSDTGAAPALHALGAIFGLTPFERDLLLLCAGIELDARFSSLCAEAQGNPDRPYPTFSLALAALDDPHWSALSPVAPLRHWRLIEIVGAPATPITVSPLKIDERILHYLAGVQHLDERLTGVIDAVSPDDDLVPSHRTAAERIESAWREASKAGHPLPMIQLCGGDAESKRSVAANACAAAGLHLFLLPADLIQLDGGEREGFQRLWTREAALMSGALYVETEGLDRNDSRLVAATTRLLEHTGGAVFLATSDRWQGLRRSTVTIDIAKPTRREQRDLWRSLLGDAAVDLNGSLDPIVTQFNMSAPAIRRSVWEALVPLDSAQSPAIKLWDASRTQARPRLDDLAQRIESAVGWDDLILPEAQNETLREIAAHLRQRATVYDGWGFGHTGTRGLGISALFVGASGTGKTMAAEVLASEFRLDLYRIDLSQVVSKYIGETEKNLRRVFDAAEGGGAILLFDEADALFGKRSEVKDSHDRYANIEVSYLLQRMEAYRGLAILTTNMKSALDQAFLRRLRFIVQFPFPNAAQRAEIWRRIFPPNTPTDGLDVDKLARLTVAGGNIRNIALNAAFLAADAGEAVRMAHLLRASRSEYAKLEKPLTDPEIRGWV